MHTLTHANSQKAKPQDGEQANATGLASNRSYALMADHCKSPSGRTTELKFRQLHWGFHKLSPPLSCPNPGPIARANPTVARLWMTGFLVPMRRAVPAMGIDQGRPPGSPSTPQEVAAMIDTEFAKQTSLDAVAQAVVDRVKRIHSDTFASGGERAKFCPRHEDMTLLVRNFGYPLGEMSQPTPTPAPGGRVYPVSVPYSSAQSTSKTSVTLSLVMPSQGQMVNGSHSASTLDEATPTLTNQSPTLTLQSTNTHTQSSSSSSDGGLFRSRPAHSLPPGEDGRVEPYVDFAEFYRLWSVDHGEQSVMTAP
ncbi:TGF-beta-activated kinase 1 and MAP3K7-binding protein 1-like [Rattus rattus]|uniref:TGF-beta-activated kinase 1 and MAP3K7-binding protein 1-like n=1 Tax=Rattus rattus TaxID=10117 RepID=UPI0013F35215|nr:TGF-beta-activated kinase 1 and MAP3K7-binding protein 1-like [Rattus rattus]